jgi:multidrug efflux system membrane fusion protein
MTFDARRSAALTARALCIGAPLLAAALVFDAGCAKQKAVPRVPTVPVSAAVATTQAVPYELGGSGTVEPLERVSVEAQVAGQLLAVRFNEGDDVTKGQVLFEIDPRPFAAALGQAQAVLARDKAQSLNAARDVERYAGLAAQEYVTSQQFESIRTNAAALRASVQADSAAVEKAQLDREYATVRAPISGRAGSLATRKGNLVRGPGDMLVTINQIKPILVRFTVPGSSLPVIQQQRMQNVRVVAEPAGGAPAQTGTLAFIDNAVDLTTGTILLKASFANRDGALWPGQFAAVRMQLYVEQDALVVPAVAVITGQQGTSVFLIDPAGTVSTRAVKVKRMAGDLAVIASGLRPGDQVVTDGQLRLVPGAKVDVKTTVAAAGTKS